MRTWTIIAITLLGISLGACSRNRDAERERWQHEQTAAEKAGKVAYQASKRAEKAVKSAARDLGKAAQQARQGWNEAEREDRAKRQTDRKDQK
jgi:hypothetical protein